MKSIYVGTQSANVGDIRCYFAPASDSTRSKLWEVSYGHLITEVPLCKTYGPLCLIY